MRRAHATAGHEEVVHVPGLKTAKRDVVRLPVRPGTRRTLRGIPSSHSSMGQPARATPSSNLRAVSTSSRVSWYRPITRRLSRTPTCGAVWERNARANGGRVLRNSVTARHAPAAFLLGRRQEVAARRFLRDPAQGELADHFPGLMGRTEREVRGSLRQETLLLRRHQSARSRADAGSRPEGVAVDILEDEDERRKLPLCLRRRLGGGPGVPRDHGIAARVDDSPRRQLEQPFRGGDAQRLDVPLSSLDPHQIGVQVHVQMRHRGREVVRQRRRRRRACRAGRRSARGGSARRSRARAISRRAKVSANPSLSGSGGPDADVR